MNYYCAYMGIKLPRESVEYKGCYTKLRKGSRKCKFIYSIPTGRVDIWEAGDIAAFDEATTENRKRKECLSCGEKDGQEKEGDM